jgi:hypothetical protein
MAVLIQYRAIILKYNGSTLHDILIFEVLAIAYVVVFLLQGVP